jgi:protein tyrosine/serine phosphatase
MSITLYSYKHEFANFREVCTGMIASKRLYRSSHPVTLSETDLVLAKLAEDAGIESVINLDDNEIQLAIKADRIPWYHCLFKKGCIIALNMDFDYTSNQFNMKLHNGFKFMLEHNGPYLIHCLQGIDGTGSMVMVLEMLMSADENEMINDYMMSFLGRQGFEKGSEHYKNEKNNFKRVLKEISGFEIISGKSNYVGTAEKYFIKEIGLDESEINLLKSILSANWNYTKDEQRKHKGEYYDGRRINN